MAETSRDNSANAADQRIVVTGVGAISALGLDAKEHWAALVAGRSGIGPLTCVEPGHVSFPNGAEVRGFDPKEVFSERPDREQDRFTQYALVTAAEAIADSGLEWTDELRTRTAVITGACIGGQVTIDDCYHQLLVEKRKRFHPHYIPRIMANAGASQITLKHGFQGPSFTLSTACSSSNHAMGMALMTMRNGLADVAICGGSEALFTLGMLKAWDAIRVVSPETCRPFNLNRPGMILGEGGAMFVLERLESATRRGARVYAELAGFGMTADAHHLTMPSTDGPSRAIRQALASGGIATDAVGYINAHGTGTAANDSNEVRAVREVFGAHADRLAMSSTKSMHGHALGAAGALEGVATVLALHEGVLPPTANFTEPDPECNIDVIPNEARESKVEAALSNSLAFGGLNAVLAFRRFDADRVGRAS